jgi:hypothetical protein
MPRLVALAASALLLFGCTPVSSAPAAVRPTPEVVAVSPSPTPPPMLTPTPSPVGVPATSQPILAPTPIPPAPAQTRTAYRQAAKAYTVALKAAEAIENGLPNCAFTVKSGPDPCDSPSVRLAWLHAAQLRWAASADAAGAFLDALAAITWPEYAKLHAADLTAIVTTHRKAMVRAARARTYGKEQSAYLSAYAEWPVQNVADKLRRRLGLPGVRRGSFSVFADHAY